MRKKSNVFATFKQRNAVVEMRTGKKVKCLSDNGGVLITWIWSNLQGWRNYSSLHHISHSTTGVAKRMNRILLEKACNMMSNAGLQKSFWAEAINTPCFLVNLSPSTAVQCTTREEVWSEKSAEYSSLLVFRCPVHY